MRQDERAAFDEALRTARLAAYPSGEFAEQESFMRAGEILSLARRAGVGPGVSVLDLCCGVAGPGRLISSELGCTYLGVDSSADAIGLARTRAAGLPCRFQVGTVPPLPDGPFDVVLLLETMLAFADKHTLVREVSTALVAGGRFAFTVEEGQPLTDAERAAMPDADTVWPVPLTELVCCLAGSGLRVRWIAEHTRAHQQVADRLVDAFVTERPAIAAALGRRAVDDLVDAHRLWGDWLRDGRIRKFAVVAEKTRIRPGTAEPGEGAARSPE
jgi:sarcosine/dimethylglycine N-methyltransferase